MRPYLLFFLVLLFSTASAQDAVEVKDLPKKAATYAIKLRFYDGSERDYKQLQPYTDKIFPQLRDLKLVSDKPDIMVVVEVNQFLEYREARFDVEYERAVFHYFTLQKRPPTSTMNQYFFQPLTLRLQDTAGKKYFTLHTIGRLFSTLPSSSSGAYTVGSPVATTPVRFPERHEEERQVVESIRFMQIHLDDLIRFQETGKDGKWAWSSED